jgi:hypothetical protein
MQRLGMPLFEKKVCLIIQEAMGINTYNNKQPYKLINFTNKHIYEQNLKPKKLIHNWDKRYQE